MTAQMKTQSGGPAQSHRHFEALYAASDDPWNVRDAWYEQRKRALLLASLRKPRYGSVFEPGCGNGEMSAALALRCDHLLACDGAASALAAAGRRLHGEAAHIRIEQRSLPSQWPAGETFDLVVISELAYYLPAGDLAALATLLRGSLADDGEIILCHYLHDFGDRVAPTVDVHATIGRLPGLLPAVRHQDQDFLIESWYLPGTAA